MAEIPRAEVQSTVNVLRDLKAAVATVRRELESARAVYQRVEDLHRQNEFYARGIDGARGRIFKLLMAQLRHAEASRADLYVARVDEALAYFAEKNKAEEKNAK